MLNRLFAAIVLLCAFCAPMVHAQQSKSQLSATITTCFPDNTSGQITPATVRNCMNTFMASWQQYAAVNAQTGSSYTVQASDYGQLVTFNTTSTVAVTLPQATGTFATFNFYASNLGTGAVTITPTTSTINSGSSFVLAQNQAVWIVSDGTNYQVWKGFGSGTVNVGTAGQMAYYPSSTASVSGNPNATISGGNLTLGQAGSVIGELSFANATSGTVTITPTTGALGTAIATLPAGTYNIVGDTLTQALTNKTYNGLTITPTTGILSIANGKTLTDTSAIGASILLGATGGGFAAYAGATCTNQALTALSAAGAGTCSSITNAFLTAGTFSNITGVGTLTAGATGAGFTINFAASTLSGTVPITNGGTSQATALAARGPNGLNIDEATSTGDANYVILSTDRTVYHTALSAARTDTLPAANSVNAGQGLFLWDPRGVVTASNTVTLQRAGADSVNGGTTFVALNAAFGVTECISDATSRWNCQQMAGGGGGSGTVTSITPGGGLVSSTSASCSQTAITVSGTLSGADCFDTRTTTSETINDSDRAKLITFNNTATTTASIAQAGGSSNFQAGWIADIRNLGLGTVTISPTTTTTSTVNGRSTWTLPQGGWGRLYSDGSNYQFGTAQSNATLQAAPSNPSGTASASRVMMGMGSTCTITPVNTGRVYVLFQGTAINTGGGNGIGYSVRYGTGSAPANAAAETGTAIGTPLTILETTASGSVVYGGLGGIVTSLTPGTAIWLDASISASAGTSSITNNSCTAYEF